MKASYKENKFENFIWIDIHNPEKEQLDDIAKRFQLDYFQIKDSLEKGHLPKLENQANYKFLILRAFTAKVDSRATNINELSNKIAFFYNGGKIISIHRAKFSFLDTDGGNFDSVEEILLYFIHKMVETFVNPSIVLADKNNIIEKSIFLKNQKQVSLEDLYYQKSQTRISKKLLQITQNVVHQIEVSEKSKTALQDIKDRLLDLVLTYDEILEDSNTLLNTYMSVNAQKTNDVMKLLTVFSAFFLPLSFIAGVYGMNFENMPELKLTWGYFGVLTLMMGIAIVIYTWFRRKKII